MTTIGDGSAGVNEFGSIINDDFINNQVIQGNVFSYQRLHDIAIDPNNILNLVFDANNVNKNNLIYLPLFFNAIGGPIEARFYLNTVYSGGTDVSADIFNKYVTLINPPGMKIIKNPTIAPGDEGILGPELRITSNGTPASASSGGETTDKVLSRLEKDTVYLVQLTNKDSKASNVTVGATWIEFD